jgi:hypothetical protein
LECDKFCISKYKLSTSNPWKNHDVSFCRQGCGLKWGSTRCEKANKPLSYDESKVEAMKYGSRLATNAELTDFMKTKYKGAILPGTTNWVATEENATSTSTTDTRNWT